jgi:hypothetical protein
MKMKPIYVWLLAAIGALVFASTASVARQPLPNCDRHHTTTPCQVTLHGSFYARTGHEGAVITPVHSEFGRDYIGTDPDPRIGFQLRRDPGLDRL